VDRALRGDERLSAVLQGELLAAIEGAADEMLTSYGTLERQYGEVFRIGRDANHAWPIGGGVGTSANGYADCRTTDAIHFPCPLTMRAFMFGKPDEQHRRYAVGGSRALRLVVLSDPLQTYTLHNYGQSSDPASPHYDDQARLLMSEGKLKPGYFTPQELAGHVSATLTLRTRD
jgi:acyl-homoserine lactone acylase PvdQ